MSFRWAQECLQPNCSVLFRAPVKQRVLKSTDLAVWECLEHWTNQLWLKWRVNRRKIVEVIQVLAMPVLFWDTRYIHKLLLFLVTGPRQQTKTRMAKAIWAHVSCDLVPRSCHHVMSLKKALPFAKM